MCCPNTNADQGCSADPSGDPAPAIVPSGFTLIELLVVVSILSLLVALLLPALQSARDIARQVQCLANQRQLGVMHHMYADSSKDFIVWGRDPEPSQLSWMQILTAEGLLHFVSNGAVDDPVLACPSAPRGDFSASGLDKKGTDIGMNWYIGRSWHATKGEPNQPAFLQNGQIPLRRSRVQFPQRTYLLGDGGGSTFLFALTIANDRGTPGLVGVDGTPVHLRHPGGEFGGWSAVYVDGHGEKEPGLDPAPPLESYSDARPYPWRPYWP